MITKHDIRRIIEGALMAYGHPLTEEAIQKLFISEEGDPDNIPDTDDIRSIILEIAQECEGHGYELVEVASGWRYQVCADTATWVNRLWEEKPPRYSRALLETLAIIAYRQPITRGDIEEIRGVAVSSHIIKTLSEREWIKVVGHRDVPGRPSLYATTRAFLDYFGINSLEQLPTLKELADLDSINPELEFDVLNESVVDEQPEGEAQSHAENEAELETETETEILSEVEDLEAIDEIENSLEDNSITQETIQ